MSANYALHGVFAALCAMGAASWSTLMLMLRWDIRRG
jgi:hypothetical protein